MPNSIPKNANEFIETQLDLRAEDLEAKLGADVITFVGPILSGVDDIVRNVIEEKAKSPAVRKRLAVILTTSGGYIEVVKRIVETLRHHYDHVAFIIPNYAYSAGTVLAMSGDDIYMDYYSRLGPIDPQVATASGQQVSALGYLIQYERLLDKARQGGLTTVEAQLMISGFDQAELYHFEQARELSITLLKEWLTKYKFKDWRETTSRKVQVTNDMRSERAENIARELNKTDKWHVHGYGISMEVLRRDLQLLINDFGDDPELNGLIRNYYSLLADYMSKRGNAGILHTSGQYVPFTD